MAKHHGKARPVTGDTSQLTVVQTHKEDVPMELPEKNKNGKWTVEKERETDCAFCAARFAKRQDRRETKKAKIKFMKDKLAELGIEV